MGDSTPRIGSSATEIGFRPSWFSLQRSGLLSRRSDMGAPLEVASRRGIRMTISHRKEIKQSGSVSKSRSGFALANCLPTNSLGLAEAERRYHSIQVQRCVVSAFSAPLRFTCLSFSFTAETQRTQRLTQRNLKLGRCQCFCPQRLPALSLLAWQSISNEVCNRVAVGGSRFANTATT